MEGVELSVNRLIILLRRYRITYLLFEFYHLHNEIFVNDRVSGTGFVAYELRREKFPMLAQPPEMRDLPIERLLPYTTPFIYTGLNYFGPCDIVVGRRREKSCGVLFTYSTVRAVNLDIATSTLAL